MTRSDEKILGTAVKNDLYEKFNDLAGAKKQLFVRACISLAVENPDFYKNVLFDYYTNAERRGKADEGL